jgi:hypothetical protein
MDGLLILSGLLAFAVVGFGWRFVHQLKRRRFISGLIWSVQGLGMFCAFFMVLLVYSNLHTYQRLTYESVIADIYVRKIGPQKFQLSLSYSDADADQHYYIVEGDQWQLDARVLKWKSWANLIGLDSFYQLDRLSGRYADIVQARTRQPSVHDLSTESQGLNVWKLKQLMRDRIGFVDALYGQGVFMPMVDGSHYKVSIGQLGLITRPANEAARSAVL